MIHVAVPTNKELIHTKQKDNKGSKQSRQITKLLYGIGQLRSNHSRPAANTGQQQTQTHND